MSKPIEIKPEEAQARAYADRLILEKITELHAAVKLSDIADRLQGTGIGLAAIRSLLASNPERFMYLERRWIPAARIEGKERPLIEALRILVDRFGGPVPFQLAVQELSATRQVTLEETEEVLRRAATLDDTVLLTDNDEIVLKEWLFPAYDEDADRAQRLYGVTFNEVNEVAKRLGEFDWRQADAISLALERTAPVSIKALGAVAFRALTQQDARSTPLYDWRAFYRRLLAVPGYVYASNGVLHPGASAKSWIASAIKLAERIAPTVEVDDAAPIEVKPNDVASVAKRLKGSDDTVTATKLLEEMYEVTPSTKTFPDDLENLMNALKAREDVWWVGGDRFRQPGAAPDFIQEVPEVFHYPESDILDEDGDPIDVELTDEGLSTSLRKLLTHPLAGDVLDEDIMPAPKAMAEQIRLVLKPIHRELGTFPLCQIPTGWLSAEPRIQELIFLKQDETELQVWANMEARLLFNLIDVFFEQPVESGAVFSLTRTNKPNVFEFAWLDQTDPVVFISLQRMEELREIQARSESMSTLDILREVMSHWPKGADFLTILWEMNVVRRVRRRLVASLLSSYHSFYQRSGSPVWHFDAKKVEQGMDKSKKRFIRKHA